MVSAVEEYRVLLPGSVIGLGGFVGKSAGICDLREKDERTIIGCVSLYIFVGERRSLMSVHQLATYGFSDIHAG